MTSPIQGSAHPLAVYDGHSCIGFIRPVIHGFEALDLERKVLGRFNSRREAADAIEEAQRTDNQERSS